MKPINTESLNRFSRSLSVLHHPVMAWSILVLSLVLTVAAYLISQQQIETRAKERFLYHSVEITQAIQDRLEHYEQVLRGGVALFNAAPDVDRGVWKNYVDALDLGSQLPGIQGLGFAIPVAAKDRQETINSIRNEGFPAFTIRPEGERLEYSTIVYLEPFDWRNQRAFGFDMWSNDIRREAMRRARDQGVPATSGIITLVQETENQVQRGFLTYLPVYNIKPAPETVEDRQRHFVGWVYAAFRAGNLMKGVLGKQDLLLNFSIYDGDAIVADNLLYESSQNLPSDASPSLRSEQTLILQGRPWHIVFSAPDNLLSFSETRQPLFVLLAGALIDLLLFYVILSLNFMHRTARRLTLQLQSDIDAAQSDLNSQRTLLALKEREATAFFDLAPDAFLVIDHQATIVNANRYALSVFGYTKSELVGKKIEVLIPEQLRSQHKPLRDEYLLAPSNRMMGGERSFSVLTASGEIFDATINLVPVEMGGGHFIVVAVHNVSTQKATERKLESARLDAEKASKSKSEFVANMSHEIRTPLNAVLGAAQLLYKTTLTEAQKNYLIMISHAGKSLLGIINDILDFSKIEAGCMTLESEAFSLDDLLDRLATMMALGVNEKQIELVIDVAPEVPAVYWGDSLRIQQILVNLVSNAIKFTEQGQIKVSIECGDPFAAEAKLLIAVQDTGIGMTMIEQKNLFKAFTQADTSITRRFGGTGLGLVISNQLLNLMSGSVVLSSIKGEGSRFDLQLPLRIEAQKDQNHAALPQQMMILDANEESAVSLKNIAVRLGWQYNLCADVETAVTQINGGYRPTGVLIDQALLQQPSTQVEALFALIGTLAPCRILLKLRARDNQASLPACYRMHVSEVLRQPITGRSLARAMTIAEVKRNKRMDGAMHSAVDGAVDGAIDGAVDSSIDRAMDRTKENTAFWGKELLLVEDNQLNQIVASGLLEDLGAVITIANNGEEAIQILREHSDRFHVVLMDIQMPVMDGFSATRFIRKELGLTLPIIAMTAGVTESEKGLCVESGMNDFVAKPIDADNLETVVARYVQQG